MHRRAVDSTGIKGEDEWHARKHGGPKRRVWRKIHLGINEQMLEVRAVENTGNHIGHVPVLTDLLSQIPTEQDIGSMTADGAYGTRNCHDAIADRGARAIIPPRKSAKPWKSSTAGATARIEIPRPRDLAELERLPPPKPRRNKMHSVNLPGQRLRVRDFDRQVADVQVRIAVINGDTALGIAATGPVG